MPARDALAAAIVASPDDDLPRLVYADYHEENGDEAYAQFVRGQVERAKTPAWEPFAVRWDRGLIPGADPNAYRDRLPNVVDDWNVEWDLTAPFRRGFGSAVRVRDLYTFLDVAPRLFDAAPVSELALPTAPLDAWRRFAVQPWLTRVKSVRFAGLSTPVEPIRCLCESPYATGLEEIYFDRANSPAMPELVAALANSPLRRQLRGLHFRMGDEHTSELVRSLGPDPWPQIERLTFVTMGVTHELLSQLAGLFPNLRDVNLSNNPLEEWFFTGLGFASVRHTVQNVTSRNLTTYYGFDTHHALPPLLTGDPFDRLRRIDLTDGAGYDFRAVLSRPDVFPAVTSLHLAHSNLDDSDILRLVRSPLWPRLVELDLSENALGRDGIDALLYAEMPENLMWIGLPDCRTNVDVGDVLTRKFAGRCE